MMACRLQQDLPCALGLEVGMASSRVGDHASGVSSRSKGQVRCRVRIWGVWGEVGGGGEVCHAGQRCLRLMLGLAGGVGGLQLIGEVVVLLA